MPETINSIKDERIILARSLNTRKGRLLHQKILLEGEQIIKWALSEKISLDFILISGQLPSDLKEEIDSKNIPIFGVSSGIIKKVTDTKYVIPCVGVAQMPPGRFDAQAEFVVVLDDLKDFGNIGTIIRTCRAFGIQDVISTSPDFDLFQRKIIDASRGSVFSARSKKFPDPEQTISYLKSAGYQIVATSPRGAGLQSLVQLKPQPVALVVGNESMGINSHIEEQADFLIQIPMMPQIESLNVGVATGISIYEIKLKQVLAMIEQQIKSTLGRELNVAGMLVQRALDAALRQVTDLTSQQVIFMMVLRCDEKMKVEEMCRQFGLLKTESGNFLDPLLDSALIEKDGENLTLTNKGEETLGKLWPVIERTDDSILSGFSSKEAAVFLQQLQQIQNKCIEIINKD